MTRDVERSRLAELLADELVRELAASERRELGALLEAHDDVSREDFELAAASLDRALLTEAELAPLSSEEIERLAAGARAFFATVTPNPDAPEKTSNSLEAKLARLDRAESPERTRSEAGGRGAILYSGWALAAVALLALFVQRRGDGEAPPEATVGSGGAALAATTDSSAAPGTSASAGPGLTVAPTPTPLEARAVLLEKEGTVRLPWAHTRDPISENVTGDVVWNAHEQTGFLHFSGLERNDPTKTQYQLWIFDAKRNEAHPVDGGVFDSTGDSVVVRIDPRVPVHEATLFAITIEPPGGVVVSERKRIVVVAKPG